MSHCLGLRFLSLSIKSKNKVRGRMVPVNPWYHSIDRIYHVKTCITYSLFIDRIFSPQYKHSLSAKMTCCHCRWKNPVLFWCLPLSTSMSSGRRVCRDLEDNPHWFLIDRSWVEVCHILDTLNPYQINGWW